MIIWIFISQIFKYHIQNHDNDYCAVENQVLNVDTLALNLMFLFKWHKKVQGSIFKEIDMLCKRAFWLRNLIKNSIDR